MAAIGTPSAPTGCVWCGAAFGQDAVVLPGRRGCPRCGAATTCPWPTDRELAHAYARYRPASGRFAGPGDALLRRLRGSLAARLDAVAPPGRVLDVGAGDGALVDALRARGREAVGLERDSRHPHVREAELTEMDGPWAAVVFWHSLEHLRAPGRALDHAATVLVSGGVVVVAIPNADSVQARLFGARWLALDLPRHLIHVPAHALLTRLRAAGLHPERISHWRGGQGLFGWLHGLVGALPGRPDLYAAIRRPAARSRPLTPAQRAGALLAAAAVTPVALAGAGLEVALRRGGSVYVEARRD